MFGLPWSITDIRYFLGCLVIACGLLCIYYSNSRSIFEWSAPSVARENSSIPLIYTITPTYYRATQLADLTRLLHTFLLVKRLHWIVVEDSALISPEVDSLLEESGINYTYFAVQRYLKTNNYLKGVDQRNAAIRWIRENHMHTRSDDAVVYFADDDNVYTLRVFEELRNTKKISCWPVGLVGGRAYEAPVVQNGTVTGFDAWMSLYREFALDMAGFAINVKVFLDHPTMYFTRNSTPGYMETDFLRQCCTLADLEPKADNCSRILVWHTHTVNPKFKRKESKIKQHIKSKTTWVV